MSGSKSKPRDVRELDLLPYSAKVRHWNRDDDPWKPDEGAYRFKNSDFPSLRTNCDGGHVLDMHPAVIGRPCYGIATALLRYRNAMRAVPKRGLMPASRCHTCKLATRCKRLVDRRLAGHPVVKNAYEKWLLAGGQSSFNEPGWRSKLAGRRWSALVRALQDHPYESSNDAAVAAYYDRLDKDKLERDRRRKRRERIADLRAGEPDFNHLRDIKAAGNARLTRVVRAVRHARKHAGPKALRQLSRASLIDLRNVWMGRELIRLQGRQPKAAEIARWIAERGLRNESSNLDALATRVRKDLHRIKSFERLEFEGEKLVPPFDTKNELT